MVWPPQSPDLNPIEQVWDLLESKIDETQKTSEAGLWRSMEEAWKKISVDELRKYINTMPERCRAVICAKGGHTRY
jgi:transposase